MAGKTPQHTVRMADVLWDDYREHRTSIGSTASEGVRELMVGELRAVGKLTGAVRDAVGIPEK